jgi:methionine sulfoxide reductase heme-binding subunit
MKVDQRYRWIYKPAIWVLCLAPLAWLTARGIGVANEGLGAEPAREVVHVLGKTALNLLLITLAVSPARWLLKNVQLLRVRRLLGLFAFAYAFLHLASYATFELGLGVGALFADIVKRPYITVGMLTVLLLLPLAITSTRAMMRRLGRRWQTLHYLVYPAAALAVVHFYWQVKADIREPLLYAGALGALLGYRLWRRFRPRADGATSMSAPATAPGKT